MASKVFRSVEKKTRVDVLLERKPIQQAARHFSCYSAQKLRLIRATKRNQGKKVKAMPKAIIKEPSSKEYVEQSGMTPNSDC